MMNSTVWQKAYQVNFIDLPEIEEVTVTRLGILPGCSSPTVDIISANGERFSTCPKHVFWTLEEAEAERTRVADQHVKSIDRDIAELQKELNELIEYKQRLLDFKNK